MILLKDNSPVPEDAVPLCREIQDQINAGRYILVDLLEDPDQEENKHPQIFQYRDKDEGGMALFTGNYVGQFERHKDGTVERVVIGARGPGFEEDEARRDTQGQFLLRAMLDACWELPLLFLEEDVEKEPGDDYGELLAARLAAQVDQAWRKGALRVYRTFQRRDSRVRGRLDIPREIRRSMGLHDGRMSYEVREYTGDNDYNRLFFRACVEAERRYPGLMIHMRKKLPGYHAAYQELQSTAGDRLDANTLLERTQKKITNPIYRDYETLRGISHAFLRRQGNYIRANESGAPFVTGISLDLSVLWERYLLKKVLPAPAEGHYQLKKCILGKKMLVKPDFWWRKEGVVLDAKYRFGWGETLDGRKWTGFLHDDVYQVLTYMLALGCDRGGVLFPVDEQRREKREYKTPIDNSPRHFWRFPFGVPDEVSDYRIFRDAMDREAQRLAGQVSKLFAPGRP